MRSWFGVPLRTFCYKPIKAPPKVDPKLVEPIKEPIGLHSSFGHRTVARFLGLDKNTVLRIFRLDNWPVKQRATGARPRAEALSSVSGAPDERRATDLARMWTARDQWLTVVLVMDCHTRELLGRHLPRSGKATTAAATPEQALTARFGTPDRVDRPILLRSDKGKVIVSRHCRFLVRRHGLEQEFITPVLSAAERQGSSD